MWKVLTREKPARRGWTICAIILTFLGVTGLAKVLVDTRSDSDNLITRQQSLPGWPVRYTLPDEYRWRMDVDSPITSALEGEDNNKVSYLGRNAIGQRCALVIGYQLLPANLTLEEVAVQLTGSVLKGSKMIQMGPMEGLMIVRRLGVRGARIVAIGYAPQGIGIVLEYVTLGDAELEKNNILSICRSFEFRE